MGKKRSTAGAIGQADTDRRRQEIKNLGIFH
jgi:hypothetical protein